MALRDRNHRRRLLGLTLLLMTLGASSCGGESDDAAKLEEAFKTDYQSAIGSPSLLKVESVQCPDDLELSAGEEFECTVTTDDGETTTEMLVTGDPNAVNWSVSEASSSGESNLSGTVRVGGSAEPPEDELP